MCGGPSRGPECLQGRGKPVSGTGWALAIPISLWEGGWVGTTRYTTLPVPTRYTTPGTPLPVHPPTRAAVDHWEHAHMTVLGGPKEILGVNNAQYSGDGQYPRRPALLAVSSLTLQQGPVGGLSQITQYFSVFLSISQI